MLQIRAWLMTALSTFIVLLVFSCVIPAQERDAQLDEAKRLNEEAVTLYNSGRYKEGIALAEKALAIREKLLGTEHLDVATTMDNLGSLYSAQGDSIQAEKMLIRALALREKALGPEHVDVASSLSNLAALFYAKGDYIRAEQYFSRALEIDEKALGPQHPTVASDLNNLGQLYQQKGDYRRSEPLLLRALAIDEKTPGENSANVAGDLNNLAALYFEMGNYSTAEPLHRRVQAILEKAVGSAHPWFAASLNNLAELYRLRAEYDRAEPLYSRTLEILQKVHGRQHHQVATVLNNVGLIARAKGDYRRAEELYLESLSIREKVLEPEHPDIGQSLNNLAELYKVRGDYENAELRYIRALTIREKALGPDHPDVGQTVNNLAELYREKSDYPRAELFYARSLKIFERQLGQEHPWVGITLNNFALLCRAQGNIVQAERFHHQALVILNKSFGSEHPLLAGTLSNLGAVYENKADVAKAVEFLNRALDVREDNLKVIFAGGSENQKQYYLNSITAETSANISLHVIRFPTDAGAARLALTTILRRKGRVLDAMSNQIATLRSHSDPEVQTLLSKLGNVRSSLANLQFSGRDILSPAVRREISELTADSERLEGEIGRRSIEFRDQMQPISLDVVRQAIPTNAALVEIFIFQPRIATAAKAHDQSSHSRYVAYVIRRDEAVPKLVDLGETAAIEKEVAQFRSALKDPKRTDVRKIARALDERVMRPIRKLLGPTRHIFLSPDGILNLIPFGALVDEHGNYLVEDYSINYLTSGRDLLRLQIHRVNQSAPVVIANPLYDLASRSALSNKAELGDGDNSSKRRSIDFKLKAYPRLSGTAEEAGALARLLPMGTQLLMDEEANEARLKHIKSPLVLHIATHGFFLPNQMQNWPTGNQGSMQEISPASSQFSLPTTWENPLLRSGLILAGVNQGQSGQGEDGVLTALEMAGLDLWGTKLVVLSACETGLGDVQNGAGVYGLRRALVLAGSEAQMMSLWKVSDAGTRDLMTAYYSRLQKSEGRAEALRQVQLMMLRGHLRGGISSDKRGTTDTGEKIVTKNYRHPYYWAAFIQSGDWRNMDGK